jgi:hypothetical protein
MTRELSEMLAELSAESKKVEDAFAAMAEDTDARAAERREKSRADAAAAVDKLEQRVASVDESISGSWRALQTKINAEVQEVQTGIADRQHERDVNRATQQADAAADRAATAVAFAAAAIQTAGLALLDADVARREAEAAKRG